MIIRTRVRIRQSAGDVDVVDVGRTGNCEEVNGSVNTGEIEPIEIVILHDVTGRIFGRAIEISYRSFFRRNNKKIN